MQREKERPRNAIKRVSPVMNGFKRNNGSAKKTKMLMRRKFGELKLGFFSDAGFRNPGFE